MTVFSALFLFRWAFTEYYLERMPTSGRWLIVDLTTDLLNVLDVAVVRPRLAYIDREDGEVITGER